MKVLAAHMPTLEWAIGLPMQAPYRTEPAALMADDTLPQWQEANPTPQQAKDLLAAMRACEALGMAHRVGATVDGDGMSAAVWVLPGESAVISYGEQGDVRLLRVDLYRNRRAMTKALAKPRGVA